ncbi:MAG: DUF5666 domain-containing protein [Myxococcota bacterium]
MTSQGLAVFLLWLVFFASSSPAAAQLPCVEFAQRGGDDGIGGTGRSSGVDGEDGLGGTGRDPGDGIGGTGIYGAITGFGSICVNGLRIHYDEEVPVERDGVPGTLRDLAVGRVVWALADVREGELWATSLSVESALRGPIEALAPQGRRFRVAGVEVRVPEGVPSPGAALAAGQSVEVSGFWRDAGTLVASRVERAPAGPALQRPRFDGPARVRGLGWVSLEGHVTPLRPETARADVARGVQGLALERAPAPDGTRVWVEVRPVAGSWRPERVRERVERPPATRRPSPDRTRPTTPDRAPEPVPAPDLERPERVERPERPLPPERPPTLDRIEPIDRQVKPATDVLR